MTALHQAEEADRREPVEAWANAVLILRRSVIQLTVASVGIGRLTMFSDYGIEGDDRQFLLGIEHNLGELTDRLGDLEDRLRAKIIEPVKDSIGDSRPQ